MPRRDPRIDDYIAKSAEFARPVLRHLRAVVHAACPGVEEDIKWGMPAFSYRGGLMCGTAAFKQHCTFGFWNRAMNLKRSEGAMGQFGCITKVSDLPADSVIVGYVRQAKTLADAGIKLGPVKKAKKPLPVPASLTAALKKKAGAAARFAKMSPSQRRDYSEWILEAKTDATRDKRLGIAVGWIAEGKSRNWKYQRS
jgi:uncharacterized protein YdeI (YjbR/CyaY-like superfamily)